jgi:DMSO/TMAO reductase YedYZ molybdopterin-dependent catalytic subunit
MSVKQNGPELKSTMRSGLLKKLQGAFREQPIEPIEAEPSMLRRWTRRDLLLFGAGALATLAVGGSQLPRQVLQRLGLDQGGTIGPENKWLLDKALQLDDDVSTALYSKHHLVPTYSKSQITPLKNNYNGATPDPSYIPGWRLSLDGLSSGLAVSLEIESLLAHHRIYDQITRLVCVEGWSAIAWWSGLTFDDLLHAYPPVSQAKWAYI